MRREKFNFKVHSICRSSLPIIGVKVIKKKKQQNDQAKRSKNSYKG